MNAPLKTAIAIAVGQALDRTKFIGGSDAAAILKLSPRDTPLDIYLYKTGQKVKVFTPQQQRAMKRGKRREPEVIEDLIALHGIKVTKRSPPENPNRYFDPEHAFLSAEVDFEWEVSAADADRFNLDHALIGTIQNGEVKTSHPFVASKQFGEEETDEIPVEYYTQGMHGLMVTGRQITMVVVGVDSNDPLIYWVKRDDETVAGMREQLVTFWNQHVLAGVPPKPVHFDDVQQLLRRDVSTEIEIPDDVLKLVFELEGLKDQAKAAEEGIEEKKFEIGKFVLGDTAIEFDPKKRKVVTGPAAKPGKHILKSGGAQVLSIGFQSQNRIDNDALRAKHPEVVAECSKTVEFFKFDSPRRKK